MSLGLIVLLEKVAPNLVAHLAKFGISKAKQIYESRGSKKEYFLEDIKGVWLAEDEKSLTRKVQLDDFGQGDFSVKVEDVFGAEHLFLADIIEKTRLRLWHLTPRMLTFINRSEKPKAMDGYIFKIINPNLMELLHTKLQNEEKPLFIGRFRKEGEKKKDAQF